MRSIALILLALVAVVPAYAGSENKAPKKWTALSSLRNHTGKIVGAVAVAAALAAVATRAVDCGQVASAVCNGTAVNQLNRMMCAKQIANMTCNPSSFSWF